MKLAEINYIDDEAPVEWPRKYRIMVVDDDEACAKLLMWAMESLEQDSQIAHDGPDALKLARALQPDLIFLDIGIPGMTGYEICQELRKDPARNNTIIVAQSGWGQKEHMERSKAAGFDYHLVKPVSVEQIKNIISLVEKGRPSA